MAATMTAPMTRKRRNVKPAHGVARLSLTINGTAYAVKPMTADPGAGVGRMYRLRKADGATYFVAEHPWGPGCDCASYEFDHADHGTVCKHIAALQAVGLLD